MTIIGQQHVFAQSKPASSPVARRAALWLLFLAPFFYLTYGTANWLASTRSDVPVVVFNWERSIPFLEWTIFPYWSINLLYALALFANRGPADVNRLAGRYLAAQIIAVACFIAFPLTASYVRPETSGLTGWLFDVLGAFDRPFNQAPSLHIALVVIIWDHLRHRMPGAALPFWHAWSLLIGLSVLTTWQHHFIDIPSGVLLGFFALWLFPTDGNDAPWAEFRLTPDPKARRLGLVYATAASVLFAAGVAGAYSSALSLVMLWPALALGIVACGYAGVGAKILQKSGDGSVSTASRVLLLPYRLGARLNMWAWTRRLDAAHPVVEGVFFGRYPKVAEAAHYATVVDLCAEFSRPSTSRTTWRSIPALDLIPLERDMLTAAAAEIETGRASGPVLVCCALGFQRSASAVAHWLVASGRATNESEATDLLRKSGRRVHLPEGCAIGCIDQTTLHDASDPRDLAGRLSAQAKRAAIPTVAALVLAPTVTLPLALGADMMLPALLLSATVVAATATLFTTAVIYFDACLFRLMATYAEPAEAGHAVDDVLYRMGLKPTRPVARALADRVAGTRNLLMAQRLSALLALGFGAAACISLGQVW